MESDYKYPEERWWDYSFAFQITNIGTELHRAVRAKNEGKEASENSFLKQVCWQIDYTLKDPKNVDKINELSKAEKNVKKYFSSKKYWYLKKTILRYFDSYLEEYRNECTRAKNDG